MSYIRHISHLVILVFFFSSVGLGTFFTHVVLSQNGQIFSDFLFCLLTAKVCRPSQVWVSTVYVGHGLMVKLGVSTIFTMVESCRKQRRW